MYTLIYLKWITNYIVQGTILNVLQWPGWEGSLEDNRYIYNGREFCLPLMCDSFIFFLTIFPPYSFERCTHRRVVETVFQWPSLGK